MASWTRENHIHSAEDRGIVKKKPSDSKYGEKWCMHGHEQIIFLSYEKNSLTLIVKVHIIIVCTLFWFDEKNQFLQLNKFNFKFRKMHDYAAVCCTNLYSEFRFFFKTGFVRATLPTSPCIGRSMLLFIPRL